MSAVPFALRLAARNLRRRPAQAALVLLTLSLATGVFGVGTALKGSADGAWNRVWNETNGFHVSAQYFRQGSLAGADPDLPAVRHDFAALAAAPHVRAVGGPWLDLSGRLDIGRHGYEDLTAEVRAPGRSAVDQPLVTAGSWLASGSNGVVLEDGLAKALHVRPGDRIRVNGRSFTVRGAAMTVSQSPFPLDLPALIWVTPATATILHGIGLRDEGLDVQLRLDDPDAADAFVAAHSHVGTNLPQASVFLQSWRDQRAHSHADLDTLSGTLLTAGVIVGLLAIATAAVIVAGRMAAQTRQIGTLKAVGVTPRQIVAALLVENLALAVLATLLGLGFGRLLAPGLAATSPSLLGAPQLPALSLSQVGTVGGVAVVVAVLSTVRPAVRGLRHTTMRALRTQARPPRRTARVARLAGALGMPLIGVLGLRSAWRRPSRLLTNAVGLALAIALIVVAAGLWSDRSSGTANGPGEALSSTVVDTLYHQVRVIVLATGALLVVLGMINAMIVASFAARDGARSHAMLRAMGVTPRQTVISMIVSQLGTCVLAIVVGLPLGLAAWRFIDNGDLSPVSVPTTDLVLVAVGVAVIFAGAVSLPAWRLAQRPVATSLGYE